MRRRAAVLVLLLWLAPGAVAWGEPEGPAAAVQGEGDPLPALLEALRHPDKSVAEGARRSLLRRSPLPSSALPQLRLALRLIVSSSEAEELLLLLARIRPLEEVVPELVAEAERLISVRRPLGTRPQGLVTPFFVEDHMRGLWGATQEDLEALCNALAAESGVWRRRYLLALVASALSRGNGLTLEKASVVLPVLRRALEGEDEGSRVEALRALRELGPFAAPLLPELLRLLGEQELPDRRGEQHSTGLRGVREETILLYVVLTGSLGSAAEPAIVPLMEFSRHAGEGPLGSVQHIGKAAKAEGRTLWWVPLRAYWFELLLCLVGLLLCWAGQAATRRSQRAFVRTWINHALAWLPILTSGIGSAIVLSREQLQPFLPEPPLTLVPLPIAGGLSAAALALLVSIWVDVSRAPSGSLDEPAEFAQ